MPNSNNFLSNDNLLSSDNVASYDNLASFNSIASGNTVASNNNVLDGNVSDSWNKFNDGNVIASGNTVDSGNVVDSNNAINSFNTINVPPPFQSNNSDSFNTSTTDVTKTTTITNTTTWEQGSQDLEHALSHFNNGDGSLLFMPQTFEQSFSGDGTDTAIAMDQVNSLVANTQASCISLDNSGNDLFNNDHLGNGATGGHISTDVGPTGTESGAVSATAGVVAQLDAFTQSIVLGANIQYNSFNTSIVGHDSITTVDPGHHG